MLKFVLNEFCIVCATFHLVNTVMFILSVLEFKDPQLPSKRPNDKEKVD